MMCLLYSFLEFSWILILNLASTITNYTHICGFHTWTEHCMSALEIEIDINPDLLYLRVSLVTSPSTVGSQVTEEWC
jgi:hypothetical protein